MKNNLSIFNNLRPITVGFDDMFDHFEHMMDDGFFRNGTVSNFPPYNIVKTGKNTYNVELALAGFNKKDIEVTYEDNLLTVKSKKENNTVYEIGCLGKISDYQKSKDGRILINLTGISRFKILKEVPNNKLYREFQVGYESFLEDVENAQNDVDAKELMEKARAFFKRNGLLLNWREFEKLDHAQKINTLAMIAPITNEEKQKLLESISLENKIKTLESVISFYLYETNGTSQTIQ